MHQIRPRDLLVVEPDARDHAVGKPHVIRMDAQLAGRDHVQPLADLVARVLDRAAVEVRAGTGGRRRGVRHLVGPGRRQPDELSGTPSAVAATWIILVCRPWPISAPPWLISTEPSL